MHIPAVRDSHPATPLLPPSPRSAAPAAADGATSRAAPEPSAFAQLVRGLGREIQGGEAVVRGAIASARGRTLDAAELIALQAGVYRYTEAVDLASRLVDHATSGLKTVVQGQ